MSKVSQLRIDALYDARRFGVIGSCGRDEIEQYIEKVDSAIDHANTKFKADILPNLVAEEAAKRQADQSAKAEQAWLNEQAMRLSRPE